MCIRRANLDAMGGRAVSTIQAHTSAVKRTVQNCRLMGKMPTIPNRGPMPCADNLGMGMAVDMLFNSITARPKLKGEKHIQFDSMQCSWSTFSVAWELSPAGIREGATFATGAMKVTVTSCPTQQRWFALFLQGAENRIGYCSAQPITHRP